MELVEAAQQAEREAIAIKVAAEADKFAAQDRAEAVTTLANAESGKLQIEAKGQAEAAKMKAAAAEVKYKVDVDGERALNEARNILSPEQIAMQVRMELMKVLPMIIRESVKPMEQIDGIKIIQVDGLTGGKGSAAETGDGSSHGGNSLSDTAGELGPEVPGAGSAGGFIACRYRPQWW